MANPKLAEIRDRIEALSKEYPEMSITAVIRIDETEDHTICGNMCLVCAVAMLTMLVLETGTSHQHIVNDDIPNGKVH